MTPISNFTAAAASWQNFYLLVGTSAATLMGLMFVAVTFGAGLISAKASTGARAFLDPPFTHFVTALLVSCLFLMPTMTPLLVAVVLLLVALLRGFALVGIFRRMRAAQARFGDIELSDWLMGVALPAAFYAGMMATSAGFFGGWSAALSGLAVVILAVLLLGAFGAWELMLWLALTHVQSKAEGPPETKVTG